MGQITVLQGESKVSRDPNAVLTTVLGSCIAVCLFDSVARVGGMNHFLLPGGSSSAVGDMRYGVNSMELLINQMLKSGAQRNRLTAKLFGGASVIQNQRNIGKSNGAFAIEFLQRENIPCLAQDVGGHSARRLRFHPTTGQAQQMLVPATKDLMEPQRPVKKAEVEADITLF